MCFYSFKRKRLKGQGNDSTFHVGCGDLGVALITAHVPLMGEEGRVQLLDCKSGQTHR